MLKVISLFRKLIGNSAEGKLPHKSASSTDSSIEQILENAEVDVISILVQSTDKQVIDSFLASRDRLALLINESNLDIFNIVVSSKAFENMIAAIHKDLPSSLVQSIRIQDNGDFFAGLKKLFIDMLYYQPYEIERNFLLNEELQKKLLQTPNLLLLYIKYVFGSFYNYVYIGEGTKHIDFYKAALKSMLALAHNCNSEEFAIFTNCFMQAYPGYMPIGNFDSLKESMTLFRQLVTLLLPEQQNENGITPLQPGLNSTGKIHLGHLRHNFTEEVHFLLIPMDKLDKSKFDVTVFAFDTTGLEQARQKYPGIKYEILNMQDINLSINKMREAKIDILINGTPLNGWGLEPHARLLLKRVAKIQCLWCADIVSSGMPSIDYWLGGEEYRHLHLEGQFTEKPHFLSGIGFFMPRAAHVPLSIGEARHQLGLNKDEIIYLSTAHILKLNPELVSVWLQIIKSVDLARLVLAPYASRALTKKMLRRLEKMLNVLCAEFDIQRERIIISDANGSAALQPLIDASDVYLDSFPYCGPTSTTEPLLVGKPVVALNGPTLRSNFTAGLLRSLNLHELVACDKEDYIAKAVNLGKNKELRNRVIEQTTEAMKNPNYLNSSLVTAELEKALLELSGNR